MRSIVAILLGLATASAAVACPRGARCATDLPQRAALAPAHRATSPSRVMRAPGARTLSLAVDNTARRAPDRTRWNLRDVPARAQYALPSILEVVRTKVAQKLPTYRNPARGISFSLSPVVVTSDAFDSAPGIGISGDF